MNTDMHTVTLPGEVTHVISRFAADLDILPASRRHYVSLVTYFFQWVEYSGRTVADLHLSDVIAYKDALLTSGKSTNTICAQVNAIKRFYAWAEGAKLYPNIARSVKAPRRVCDEYRRKPLTLDKSCDLLRSVESSGSLRDAAIINLMLRTGLRCSEVCRANIEDMTILCNGTRVLKVQGKGHLDKDDYVIITDSTYKAIRPYLMTRKGAQGREPLFVSEGSKTALPSNHEGEANFHKRRLSRRSVSRICKDYLRKVGLEDKQFCAHSLRHTTGTNILRGGGSLEQAQMTLRHANPSTTQIYVKMALKERRLLNGGELVLESFMASAMGLNDGKTDNRISDK